MSGPPTELTCPRCRYDLAWIPEQWTSACPLEGTCPECGLVFEWPVLMNPSLVAPPWFCEHPIRPPRWGLPRTLWRVLRPVSFWRSVPIEIPIRARPLLVTLLASLIVSYLLVGLMVATYEHDSFFRTLVVEPGPVILDLLVPMRVDWFIGTFSRELVAIGLAWLSMPVLFAVLPETRSRARVSWTTLLRPTCYAGVGLVMMVGAFWVVMWSEDPSSGGFFPQLFVDDSLIWIGGHWLVLIWLGVFWWHANRAMRLAHAPAITFAQITIAILVAWVALTIHWLT